MVHWGVGFQTDLFAAFCSEHKIMNQLKDSEMTKRSKLWMMTLPPLLWVIHEILLLFIYTFIHISKCILKNKMFLKVSHCLLSPILLLLLCMYSVYIKNTTIKWWTKGKRDILPPEEMYSIAIGEEIPYYDRKRCLMEAVCHIYIPVKF